MNEVNGDSVLSEIKERCIKLSWGKISTKREKRLLRTLSSIKLITFLL